MSLYEFNITVHPRPATLRVGGSQTLRGLEFATVELAATDAELGFERSFEEVAAALEQFPRMFFEPDGSFVWVSNDSPAWQLDGVLFDRNSRVLYAELKGTCPAEALDQFLAALGRSAAECVFQLQRAAVTLNEIEFRRYATA